MSPDARCSAEGASPLEPADVDSCPPSRPFEVKSSSSTINESDVSAVEVSMIVESVETAAMCYELQLSEWCWVGEERWSRRSHM